MHHESPQLSSIGHGTFMAHKTSGLTGSGKNLIGISMLTSGIANDVNPTSLEKILPL